MSCGIPDFRSPTGIYARLSQEFPELPDPQAMFDIHYFKDDPRPFFRFAKVSVVQENSRVSIDVSEARSDPVIPVYECAYGVFPPHPPPQAIYPGQFSPSPSHRFISALEKRRKLLRNYTQNIDTLEQAAGITRVVHCHGKMEGGLLGPCAGHHHFADSTS